MNRLISIAIAVIIAVMLPTMICACGEKLPSSEDCLSYQTYPLAVTAHYSCNGNEADVRIVMTDRFVGSVSYITPETLAGFTAQVDGDSVTFSCGITLPSLNLPDSEPVFIASMLSLVPERMLSVEADRGTMTCTAVFASDKGDVVVRFDAESGNVLSLACPDAGIEISEVKIDTEG